MTDQDASGAVEHINLLVKAVGDITAALTMAGKDDKIAAWTAPYVKAINRADAGTPVEPAPYTCKHGCERDALMDRIHAFEVAQTTPTNPSEQPDKALMPEGAIMEAARRVHAAHMEMKGPLSAWTWEEATKSFYRSLALAALNWPVEERVNAATAEQVEEAYKIEVAEANRLEREGAIDYRELKATVNTAARMRAVIDEALTAYRSRPAPDGEALADEYAALVTFGGEIGTAHVPPEMSARILAALEAGR